MHLIKLVAPWMISAVLLGCGDSGGRLATPSSGGVGGGGITPSCATPMAPAQFDQSLVVNLPSDFDATAVPAPTPTTTINFSVFLPSRCPGDHFPVILQSHGYSGTRQKVLSANGSFEPNSAYFPSIDKLVTSLPFHGYVVVSYDERGHGTAAPGRAAHYARVIDPAAETQDAIAILDWVYDHIDDSTFNSFAQADVGTGIAKDLRLGTIGLSYGGGFQMPLALLDQRVDAIVPNGTWNNLIYSLLPGDSVKLGFDSLLCVLATQGNVNNSPVVAALCNLIGPQGASAASLRTRADLGAAVTTMGVPRNARDADELLNLFYTHSTRYFELQTRDGKTIRAEDRPGYVSPALTALTGTPSSPGITIPNSATRRPIPALFIQGNRDTLFNLTDASFNYRYFKAAGGDVRLLTNEGGHMNPLAQQIEGTAQCGGVRTLDTILAWFNQKLKGQNSADFTNTPQVCISVTPTPAANAAPLNTALVGVLLNDLPVGNLGGTTGGIATVAASITGTVGPTAGNTPVFVPVGSPISVGNAVLAGIPRIESVNVVTGNPLPGPATPTAVAYVGVGIRRGTTTILVDDEVTPFSAIAPDTGTTPNPCPASLNLPATAHCNNRSTGNNTVLLPGVGEVLQSGDQLGLLFYQNHVQYLPANSGGQAGLPNPYTVTMTQVELPVLVPGNFPDSRWSCGSPTANPNCP